MWVLSEDLCSDPKQLPVRYINYLTFANLYPIVHDERDRLSFPRRFDGFSKHPHLAKISSTSVWTPENFKNFLWFLISLLHCVSGIIDVEELLRSSAPQIPPTILTNEHDIVFLCFPSNKLWFFWGKCVVYLDKEAIFTFRGKSCLLLAYATTCSLSSVKKLINFGPICMTNRTCFHLFARLYGQCSPHTSTTKIVLNMTYSDSTDLK